MAINRKKHTEHTEQNVLSAIFIRSANAIRNAIFGWDGSDYIAIKTDSSGVVKVCDINAAAAAGAKQYTDYSAASAGQVGNLIIGRNRTTSENQLLRVGVSGAALVSTLGAGLGVTRVSADVLQTLNAAASGLYVRFGTDAAKISAIQVANNKVSIIAGSSSATRVSADLLKTLNAAGSALYIRPGTSATFELAAGTNAVGKVSAIQVAAHKASAALTNQLSRVSADVLSNANVKVSAIQVAAHKASAAITNPTTRVTSDVIAALPAGTNAVGKASAIYNEPHTVSATYHNMTLSASALINAAGSAEVVAGSAGITRRITDIFMSSYADDIKVSIKGGGRKLTPWMKLKDGSGLAHSFGLRPAAIAGSAVKVSSSGGSASVVVHRF